jgi:uncharacterized protein (TIGR03067 family)
MCRTWIVLLVALISFGLSGASAQEPLAGPQARALQTTRDIVFTLDQLDDELKVYAKEPGVDRNWLLQTQAAFGAALTLQNMLRPGANKQLIALRYETLDRQLDQLIARVSNAPQRLRSIHLALRQLRFESEQLEQILGHHGPDAGPNVIVRQAARVESAAHDLQEAAASVQWLGAEDDRLRAWTAKLAARTASFRGEAQRGVPYNVLRKEYLIIHQLWEATARQIGEAPPRLYYNLRVRAERFAAGHQRLCGLLGLQVSQPELPFHPDNAEEKALEQLEGTWYLVSNRVDGRPAPKSATNHVMTITGNRWHNILDGTIAGGGTIRVVDASSQPWKVNFQSDGDPNRSLAIMQVDGQFLRYCAAPNNRPGDFNTRPGDGRSFSLWRRVRLE